MADPWAAWNAMIKAGTMVTETLDASRRVVNARQETISDAMTDPFHADHRELALMVGEKTDAFTSAGAALANSWFSMQSDVAAQAMAVGGMMMAGKVPSAKATQAMAARQLRIGDAALRGSMKALRPIHAAATANARRLGKAS